jgi:protein Tex
MNFEQWFQKNEAHIPVPSAQAVLRLAGEGGTVPFIARYRKEATGNLDEVAIQAVIRAKESWDEIVKRQAFILKEIGDQKKLTPELKAKIEAAFDLSVLEDLYLPYKRKKQTKAQKAREAGLGPLADWLWDTAHGVAGAESSDVASMAAKFVNAEKEIADGEAALAGARDILTEKIAETAELRQLTRDRAFKEGAMKSAKGEKAKEASKFQDYFDHKEGVASLMKPQNSHRYLAMRRGWMEEELQLGLHLEEATLQGIEKAFESHAVTAPQAPSADTLRTVAKLALKAYVLPAVETEAHKNLKDLADTVAIKVFAENVRKLLMAAPFGAKAVLGVDPGLRTGCKVAIIDASGKYLGSFVFHLHSDTEKPQAALLISEMVKNGNIQAVAVGNGTGGREAEGFLRSALKEKGVSVPVVMVSEAGASVYSASEVAREEFPDLDITVRGAISIARRLQDPLAELVKTDPKSIGVGQYQHDVSQPQLKRSLEEVVDSCVNSVGVDLNTASPYLLARVSGIGPALAKNIVEHRGTKGLYRSRQELLKVSRFSEKVFEQAAGFLRIAGGDHPLDNTGVHPERYEALENFAKSAGKTTADLLGAGVALVKGATALKEALGPFTFQDVVQELEKPGRDPREKFEVFQFREDIREIKDLKVEMVCPGIVTNVANFGAFVDIGVHQDGLVHLSQLADKFVKDPRDVVSPGDRVMVRVLEVDVARSRISLTMKSPEAQRKREAPPPQKRAAPPPQKKRPPPPPPRPRHSDKLTQNPFAALAALKTKKD